MKLLIVNGPNMNMLGVREPEIYGAQTYADLTALIRREAARLGVTVELFQSNHEGAIVDAIQSAWGRMDGIVINPAAYTHTSVALLDALRAVQIPTVEVHISKVDEREAFRQISYVSYFASEKIIGKGLDGYLEAIDYLEANV